MNRPQRNARPNTLYQDFVLSSNNSRVRNPPPPPPQQQEGAIPAILANEILLNEPNPKILSKDWGEWNNPFWLDHFYNPNDNISDLYRTATEKLAGILPANFELIQGEKSAFGVANLELKPQFKKNIKKIPLLSKLQNGDYQTVGSKSDKNISASIKFFINNLPSFRQYKNNDEIDWVIYNHRLLTAEILNYYADKGNPSLATIKSRFNAITRIFRIAFETKNYYLYDKYASLVLFLTQQFEADEFNNELSDNEFKKFIDFSVVLELQRKLNIQFQAIQNKNSVNAYDINQNLILVSLYSLIPPLRKELFTIKFTTQSKRNGDWVYFRDNDVLLDLNEEKKKHPEITFNLSNDAPELAKLLKQSYELYPREFVFTPFKTFPNVSKQASVSSIETRLNNLFAFTGKSVSVNSLRSSYVSYMNMEAIRKGRQLTVNDKEKIAHKMRSSRKYLDEAYLKLFPIQAQNQTSIKQEIKVEDVDERTPYQKQLTRNQQYYNTHKDEILKKQKEYKQSIPKEDKNRKKILYYLNNDPEYHSKMKESTKQKYDFKRDGNGRWI